MLNLNSAGLLRIPELGNIELPGHLQPATIFCKPKFIR